MSTPVCLVALPDRDRDVKSGRQEIDEDERPAIAFRFGHIASGSHQAGDVGIWPLLVSGEARTNTPDVYCEYYNAMPWHREPHLPFATMLRTDTMKLVLSHGDKRGELYDLVSDPGETDNLWDQRDRLETRCELMQRLCDRMAFTVDPLPLRRAPW